MQSNGFSKYFYGSDNDFEDWEEERLDLEADRAFNQLKLSELEEQEKIVKRLGNLKETLPITEKLS